MTVVIGIAVMFLFGGCFITDYFSQQLGKKVGEEIVKKSTGAKDVQVDDKNVKITTDDGTWESSSDNKLPSYWPSDVPTKSGYTITYTYKAEANGSTSYSLLQSKDNVDTTALKEYFLTAFADKGWTKDAEYSSTNYESMTFKKSENTAAVSISTSDTTTTVTITASIKD